MPTLLLSILLLCLTACAEGQHAAPTAAPDPAPAATPAPSAKADAPNDLHRALASTYEQYRDGRLTHRRFKHKDLVPIIRQLGAPFTTQVRGQSVEGRDIYTVTAGNGPVKVLLWSQMHGDEPTATMALADIFRFLAAKGDGFDTLRQTLLSRLTFCAIPMLNPDGADRYQRRNALGIDLNRDALRLQMPESKILKAVRDELSADWGFNLHDQSRYYAAGRQPKTAAVSFLAPAFNEAKDINERRAEAMQLTGRMVQVLEAYIPGQMARYDDTFEPRAFGDNMQRWGTRTILVESGGLKDDPEKQELRRLHYLILLSALADIASHQHQPADRTRYDALPLNNGNAFFDLVVRDVEVQQSGLRYLTDVGYRHQDASKPGVVGKASIGDVGDLSVFFGYEELDGQGMQATLGRVYPQRVASVAALRQLDLAKLLRDGYTIVSVAEMPTGKGYAQLPLRLTTEAKPKIGAILPGQSPDLVLQKNGRTQYVVVNGRPFEASQVQGTLGEWADRYK